MKHALSTVLAFALVAGVGATMALPAAAQVQPPHRKPGMWEQSVQLPGNKPMTMKMCVDETTESLYSGMAKRPGCTQEFQKIPGGYSFKGTCQGKTATGTAIGDFDKAIKVEVDSEGAHLTSNLKYLGPCPADRKPGDMVMPNGQVVNVKNLPH
jgi:hypothetical protein